MKSQTVKHLTFEESKTCFTCNADIVFNNNTICGQWVVRKTASQKMWVVEYFKNNYIFLAAQTVFCNEINAFDHVAECTTNAITGQNGKWHITGANNAPAKYTVERIPESYINWA
jgi:hypothetical protein